MTTDTFSALAVPTRRTIVEMLAKKGTMSATDICKGFAVSAPAISQHLGVLLDAHLVVVKKHGQHRLYQINPKAMAELEHWAAQMTRLWEKRYDALDTVLKAEKRKMIKN